jgi:hypothetical protein
LSLKGKGNCRRTTFPKGKSEPGSTPEETALREVKEETGYMAEIVAKIPGQFEGETGITEYFLMRPLGEPDAFDRAETQAITWISLDKAPRHISQTKNVIGRKRDQGVLDRVVQYLRESATRFSIRLYDMPAKNTRLPFKMRFSPGEFARLKKGHRIGEIEEKWHIFFENNWLSFHRGTGVCIYRLRLEPDGDCFRVAEAWANREPEQQGCEKKSEDGNFLLVLLFNCFRIGSQPSW